MTLSPRTIKNIVKSVITGEDYRMEIVDLIDGEFLRYVIDFFKEIVDRKLKNETVTDWYRERFLNRELPKEKIAINSGLNLKTVENMYRSTAKEIVIDVADEHYDNLNQLIENLIDSEEDLSLTLTIKFKNVAVDLTINETLIVINSLAVKRAALRGGAWSAVGKGVEKILMKTLCELYNVPAANYDSAPFVRDKNKRVDREVDFYFLDGKGEKYRCEVKLMGKGNPESADSSFSRCSNVFVADTLSKQNKDQADEWGIVWVELRMKDGYKRLKEAFDRFGIPYTNYNGKLDKDLDCILEKLNDEHWF